MMDLDLDKFDIVELHARLLIENQELYLNQIKQAKVKKYDLKIVVLFREQFERFFTKLFKLFEHMCVRNSHLADMLSKAEDTFSIKENINTLNKLLAFIFQALAQACHKHKSLFGVMPRAMPSNGI